MEEALKNLELILKPLDSYPGEWEIGPCLEEISLSKKGKNKYREFLNRYYYLPLNVIFKDEDLIKSFDYAICSRIINGRRKLYFSKKVFFRNVISNIDDVINSNGESAYKDIKKALRMKKDMYRDVYKLSVKSEYYEDVIIDYKRCNVDIKFEEFVKISKKKYTRLLGGYNALLTIFDKPIDLEKLLGCFQEDQLYLYVIYSLVKLNDNYMDVYSRLDFTIKYIDKYISFVENERKKNSFYNTYIIVSERKENKVYTVDDLMHDYKLLLERITK